LIIRDRLTPSDGVDLGAVRVRGVGLGDVRVRRLALGGVRVRRLALGGVRVRRLALGGLRVGIVVSFRRRYCSALIVSTSVFTVVA
jgi:hypothetical protein